MSEPGSLQRDARRAQARRGRVAKRHCSRVWALPLPGAPERRMTGVRDPAIGKSGSFDPDQFYRLHVWYNTSVVLLEVES
jgi:hypothetical protein